MLILGLLGMYFDAAVVFVTKNSLFFRLAMAILWLTNETPVSLARGHLRITQSTVSEISILKFLCQELKTF